MGEQVAGREYITVDHKHMTTYVQSVDPLWLMVVECNDGRFFLEAEFDDDEFRPIEDVYMGSRESPPVFFASSEEALKRALEIAKTLRPLSNRHMLEELIAEAAGP